MEMKLIECRSFSRGLGLTKLVVRQEVINKYIYLFIFYNQVTTK